CLRGVPFRQSLFFFHCLPPHSDLRSFPTRRSSDLYFKMFASMRKGEKKYLLLFDAIDRQEVYDETALKEEFRNERFVRQLGVARSEEHTSELQSRENLVCRLLLEKKKIHNHNVAQH